MFVLLLVHMISSITFSMLHSSTSRTRYVQHPLHIIWLLIFGWLLAQPQSKPNLVNHTEMLMPMGKTSMWVQVKDTNCSHISVVFPSLFSQHWTTSIGYKHSEQILTLLLYIQDLDLKFTLPQLSHPPTTPSPTMHQCTPPSLTVVWPHPHNLTVKANQVLTDFKELDQQRKTRCSPNFHVCITSPCGVDEGKPLCKPL